MATDIVSVIALQLSTTVGPDCWNRSRPQPIQLTVHLHLLPHFLDAAGQTDSVTDSLHYGQLTKAVERRVSEREASKGFYAGVRGLLEDVTDAAFAFVSASSTTTTALGSVHAVRVIATLSKQILLAGNFEAELTTPVTAWVPSTSGSLAPSSTQTQTQTQIPPVPGPIVRVADLVLPVLIGVNPPERLSKQRVITHITFHESGRADSYGNGNGEIDYPAIIKEISAIIEKTDYLTLEKLVLEIINTAYRASTVTSDAFDSITVCCQKPSALSFAHVSSVQITRRREEVVLV